MSTRMSTDVPPFDGGLDDLDRVQLNEDNRRRLAAAAERAATTGPWAQRRFAEVSSLLAMAQALPWRMHVIDLDIRDAICAVIGLNVAVPCRAPGAAQIFVHDGALLALRYPEQAVRQVLTGFPFVEVLLPRQVFHPSVGGPDGLQILCLGHLPAGTRVRELVLLSYAALQMTTVQMDERDPQGVMNIEAARYFQATGAQPLSRTSFLQRS